MLKMDLFCCVRWRLLILILALKLTYIHGKWSAWSEPTICSRSCGGGISFKERTCLSLGSSSVTICHGEKRKYSYCNTQTCPKSNIDFRERQCYLFGKHFETHTNTIWIPYESASRPCALYCFLVATERMHLLRQKVIDGTHCQLVKVCIDGHCSRLNNDEQSRVRIKRDICDDMECGNSSVFMMESTDAYKTESPAYVKNNFPNNLNANVQEGITINKVSKEKINVISQYLKIIKSFENMEKVVAKQMNTNSISFTSSDFDKNTNMAKEKELTTSDLYESTEKVSDIQMDSNAVDSTTAHSLKNPDKAEKKELTTFNLFESTEKVREMESSTNVIDLMTLSLGKNRVKVEKQEMSSNYNFLVLSTVNAIDPLSEAESTRDNYLNSEININDVKYANAVNTDTGSFTIADLYTHTYKTTENPLANEIINTSNMDPFEINTDLESFADHKIETETNEFINYSEKNIDFKNTTEKAQIMTINIENIIDTTEASVKDLLIYTNNRESESEVEYTAHTTVSENFIEVTDKPNTNNFISNSDKVTEFEYMAGATENKGIDQLKYTDQRIELDKFTYLNMNSKVDDLIKVNEFKYIRETTEDDRIESDQLRHIDRNTEFEIFSDSTDEPNEIDLLGDSKKVTEFEYIMNTTKYEKIESDQLGYTEKSATKDIDQITEIPVQLSNTLKSFETGLDNQIKSISINTEKIPMEEEMANVTPKTLETTATTETTLPIEHLLTSDCDLKTNADADACWKENGWSSTSECTRHCGIGIKYRIYLRNSIGQERKKYELCNIHDCPKDEKDFRIFQCEILNYLPYLNAFYKWKSYFNETDPCGLYCMHAGKEFFHEHEPKAIDGTRCNGRELDICIDGKCTHLGCDRKLNSNLEFDNCMKCGGDNSKCTKMSGIFNKEDLTNGYMEIAIKPKGATRIRFEEKELSNNFLAARNSKGVYYFNGDKRPDYPQEFFFVNCWWNYERIQSENLTRDALNCNGPIRENVNIMLYGVDKSVNVKYEFYERNEPIDDSLEAEAEDSKEAEKNEIIKTRKSSIEDLKQRRQTTSDYMERGIDRHDWEEITVSTTEREAPPDRTWPRANMYEICTLPVETGPCKNYGFKWYFKPDALKCYQFYYGGCEGNENNFISYEQCMKFCMSLSEDVDLNDVRSFL